MTIPLTCEECGEKSELGDDDLWVEALEDSTMVLFVFNCPKCGRISKSPLEFLDSYPESGISEDEIADFLTQLYGGGDLHSELG